MRSLEKMDVLAEGLEAIEPGALRRAARDVVEQWPEGPGHPTPHLIAEELTRLSGVISEIRSGGSPRAVDFHADLLDLIRAQLLEQLQEDHFDTEEVEGVVHALEDLDRARTEATELSAARLLQSPDGFQLVVEMAHDLRSPLSSILFLADTLRRGHSGDITGLQKKQLGLIYSAALGLASVVNDVMELAKGGGTLRDEQDQLFSITQTVNTVMETVGPVAEEKGITLRKDVQFADHVRGHPISIGRVLLNLVTNAVHHTSDGYVAVSVKGAGRNEVVFSVEDTGCGIPEEARETVFEPFKQGPNQSRMLFSGTGLGLSIARALVRAMGGEIGFVSEVGRGTRFWFRVPVSAP